MSEQPSQFSEFSESSESSQLGQLQRWFWKFVVAPYGVKDVLAQMEQEEPLSVPLRRWIGSPSEEDAIRRLDIYANMYFFRLANILHEEFEALAVVLGDRFLPMCTDYLRLRPPTTYSLDQIIAGLPPFLQEHCPPEQPPWLTELASLEATRYRLITGPDTTPLDAISLQQIPPDQWGNIRFQVVPSFALLDCHYPVHQVWKAAIEKEEIPIIHQESTTIVVWRQGFRVTHDVVWPEARQAYHLLLQQAPFEDLCLSFLSDPASEDLSAEDMQSSVQQAYQCLSHWVQQGMLDSLR